MLFRALLVLLLLTGAAAAHDLYLVTGIPGARGRICARVGEHFPASMNAITADRIRWFRVRGAGEPQELTGKVEPVRKQFCARYAGKGAAVAEMVVPPRFIELSPKNFAAYTQGEGFRHIERLRAERGEQEQSGRELYSRYSKLLIGATGELATKPLGHVLEIVPEKDPAALKPGEALTVRVLFRGKPLPDAQVAAVYSGAELKAHEWPVVTRTDANGRAQLKLDRGGLWYARMIWMVPAEDDPDYQWRSFFATVTFTIPQK